jgi:hypothetical protein
MTKLLCAARASCGLFFDMLTTMDAVVRMNAVVDLDGIIDLLSEAARKSHVGAMRLLLEELGGSGEDEAASTSVIDQLATKRKSPATVD